MNAFIKDNFFVQKWRKIKNGKLCFLKKIEFQPVILIFKRITNDLSRFNLLALGYWQLFEPYKI